MLKSLLMIITPDILAFFKKHNVCGEGLSEIAIKQHETILEHIRKQDHEKAGLALADHLSNIVEYVNSADFNRLSNGQQ